MAEQIFPPELIQATIARLENLVQAFGWTVIATDTRGENVTVTLTKPKENIRTTLPTREA